MHAAATRKTLIASVPANRIRVIIRIPPITLERLPYLQIASSLIWIPVKIRPEVHPALHTTGMDRLTTGGTALSISQPRPTFMEAEIGRKTD